MSIKISSEDLVEINQLQQDYTQIKFSIGETAVKIFDLEQKLQELRVEKLNDLDTYSTIVERDKDLNTKMSEKYGRGIIDMSLGEMIIQ